MPLRCSPRQFGLQHTEFGHSAGPICNVLHRHRRIENCRKLQTHFPTYKSCSTLVPLNTIINQNNTIQVDRMRDFSERLSRSRRTKSAGPSDKRWLTGTCQGAPADRRRPHAGMARGTRIPSGDGRLPLLDHLTGVHRTPTAVSGHRIRAVDALRSGGIIRHNMQLLYSS
jgi:hypothetical protein